MKTIILKRLLSSLLVVVALTILVFLIVQLLPGDPVTLMLGEFASEEQIELVRAQYNLDKSLPTQYFIWLGNILKGDWGQSIVSKAPVMPQILERLPRTLMICLVSTAISLVIAVWLGVVSANRNNSYLDLGISVGSLTMMSVPEFWMGVMLMLLFSVKFQLLPAGGYVKPSVDLLKSIKSMILPVTAMVLYGMPPMLRMVRSSMIETLGEDYVMLARTKGNSPIRCNYVHALRNSLIPISTMVSIRITSLMAGAIVIEKVFQFPGMGLLLLSAIQSRDYPMIQACIFVFSLFVVFVNLATDIVYAAIDPKIRYS